MNLTIRILIGMVAGLTLGMLVQLSGAEPDGLIRTYLIEGLLDAGGRSSSPA